MDELSSLLDSVVAEAEAYLTSPNVNSDTSSERILVSQKKRKVPPPVPKKPNSAQRCSLFKSQNSVGSQLSVGNSIKAVAPTFHDSAPFVNRGLFPPPCPVPYAESPAAKRRVSHAHESLVASSQNTSMCNLKSAMQCKRDSTVCNVRESSEASKSTGGSYQYKGSVTPLPFRSQYLLDDMKTSDQRARSGSLPTSTRVVSENATSMAFCHLVLSGVTGTVRGIKGQVKERVRSFPDVPNALFDSDKHNTEDRCLDFADSKKGDSFTENVYGQDVMDTSTATVNEEIASFHVNEEQGENCVFAQPQSFDLHVPSVSRTRVDRIVLNFPPPPAESPPLSSTLSSYSPFTSYDNVKLGPSDPDSEDCKFPALLPLPISEEVVSTANSINYSATITGFPTVLPSPITEEALAFSNNIDNGDRALYADCSSLCGKNGVEKRDEMHTSKEIMPVQLPPFPDVIDELDCQSSNDMLDMLPPPPPLTASLLEGSTSANSETDAASEFQFNFDDTVISPVRNSATDFPLAAEFLSPSSEVDSHEVQLGYELADTSEGVESKLNSPFLLLKEIVTENKEIVWDEGVSTLEDVTSKTVNVSVNCREAFPDENISIDEESRQLAVPSCSLLVAQQAMQGNGNSIVNFANTQAQSECSQSLSLPGDCEETSACETELMPTLGQSQPGMLQVPSTNHHCVTVGISAAPSQSLSSSLLASAPQTLMTEAGETKANCNSDCKNKSLSLESSLAALDCGYLLGGVTVVCNNVKEVTCTSAEAMPLLSPAWLSHPQTISDQLEKSCCMQQSVYASDYVCREGHGGPPADSVMNMDDDGVVSSLTEEEGGSERSHVTTLSDTLSPFSGAAIASRYDIAISPMMESEVVNTGQGDSISHFKGGSVNNTVLLDSSSSDFNTSPSLDEGGDCCCE